MMIGSFRWNLFAGAVGFLGTLLASLPRNVWSTAFIHSCYSFLFLFIFTFAFRWVLGLLVQSSEMSRVKVEQPGAGAEPHRGRSIDLSTPEDGGMPGSQSDPAPEESFAFTPLNPPKLSTKLDQDPDELAKALRRMTEE